MTKQGSDPAAGSDPVPLPAVGSGSGWTRRETLKVLTAAGVGSLAFRRALAALADGAPAIDAKMVREAEWIAGVEFTRSERELMLDDLRERAAHFAAIRAVELDNTVHPALLFHPAPLAPPAPAGSATPAAPAAASPTRPAGEEELAFASVRELGALIRARQVSSAELTELYLDRLERHDPALRCVITRTADLARSQAERADRDLAEGRWRGPLHGLPWGVKDLFAVPGYPTTWGAAPYRHQVRAEKATVVARLEDAGAPLLAKLAVGELAWGDVWFDGMTRNPWNTEQGSSGSSAGSAAATAAGLVAFSIGTETWGSIVSPCTRCGVTGLRPTFGRISRHGAMALAWSMDKVGPIARSADDCALVLEALHGADGLDPTAVDRPFRWDPERDPRTLRVGFVQALFEGAPAVQEGEEGDEARARGREGLEFDRRTLDVLRQLGVELVPVNLPQAYPVEALSFILTAEAAAAFDELTRSGRDDLMVRQERLAWPNVFRHGQLIPAVEYLRANRVRTLLMRELERALAGVDVLVTPSFGGNLLLLTNLTGHPAVVLPNGFRAGDGTPTSITFTGRLYGEATLLSLAHAYQRATDFHRRRPALGAGGAPGSESAKTSSR